MPLTGGNYAYLDQSNGFVQYLTPANPAAGANLTMTVPTLPAGEVWLPMTVFCVFTTGAAVANRTMLLNFFTDGGGLAWRTGAVAADIQTANLVWGYSFFTTCGDVSTRRTIAGMAFASLVSNGMADCYLLANGYMQLQVSNIQAADQISDVCVCLQKWRMQ